MRLDKAASQHISVTLSDHREHDNPENCPKVVITGLYLEKRRKKEESRKEGVIPFSGLLSR